MKCPHCFQNHPAGTIVCPMTGYRIPGSEEFSKYNKTKDVIWSYMGALGIIMVVVGLMLLGDLQLPERISFWRNNEFKQQAMSESSGTQNQDANSSASGHSQDNGQQFDPTKTVDQSHQTSIAQNIQPTKTPQPTGTPILLNPPGDPMIVYALGDYEEADIFIMYVNSGKTLRITNNNYEDKAPSFSPDNKKLVYQSNRDQGWELYIYDIETGEEKRLTTFDGEAKFPNWSPVVGDERIVFEGRQGVYGKYDINVWLVNADGSELEQLTFSNSDNRPIWSGDGSLIIFGRATKDSNNNGRVSSSDNLDVFTLKPENRAIQQLTKTDDIDEFQFGSSPDGELIVFSAVSGDANHDGDRNLSDTRDLHFMNIDGSNQSTIKLNNYEIYSPDISPDGQFVSFNIWFNNDDSAIWIYNQANGEIIELTDRGPYYHPEWSH